MYIIKQWKTQAHSNTAQWKCHLQIHCKTRSTISKGVDMSI